MTAPTSAAEKPEDPEVFAHCHGCDALILSGDQYFFWEDANTCLKCGSDSPGHKTSLAP